MAIRKLNPFARLDDVIAVVNQLVTLANEIKADFNAHKHGASADGPTLTVAASDADSLAYRGIDTPT